MLLTLNFCVFVCLFVCVYLLFLCCTALLLPLLTQVRHYPPVSQPIFCLLSRNKRILIIIIIISGLFPHFHGAIGNGARLSRPMASIRPSSPQFPFHSIFFYFFPLPPYAANFPLHNAWGGFTFPHPIGIQSNDGTITTSAMW